MSIRKRTWKSGGIEKSAWVVDYKDQRAKRRQKTFQTRKQADKWATQALYHVSQGTHTPDSESISVSDAAELWLKRAEIEGLEPSTIRYYKTLVVHHVNPLIGRERLSGLNAPRVQEFRDTLLETRSRVMAQKSLTALKGIIAEAHRRGLVAQNVARDVKIRVAARHTTTVDIPTREEIELIVKEATGRWRPILVTAIFTGLRASELRALAWENVDFDRGLIRVTRRADRWNRIGSPKSEAARREVPLYPIVANTLSQWKKECPASELGLVFPTGRGGVENLGNIHRRGFAPIQLKNGMTVETGRVDEEGKPILRAKYSMHALRHWFASWLIDQGVKAKKIQSILGHASIQMTFDTYGHLFKDDDEAELERLATSAAALVA